MRSNNTARGFSLIELMVAIAVGAIVLAALVTIAGDTLATARTQDGVARVQENGRYALARLRRDIHQMMYMPLNNAAPSIPRADTAGAGPGGQVYLTSTPRTYESYLAVGVPAFGFQPGALDTLRETPNGFYRIPQNFLISVHECDVGCAPPTNIVQAAWPEVPPEGSTAGARMPGTDILTTRTIVHNGARIANQGRFRNCPAGDVGTVPGFPQIGCPNGAIALVGGLDPTLPPLNLKDGDVVMIAGAQYAAIFSATLVPGGIAAIGGGLNVQNAGPNAMVLAPENARAETEPRVFNLAHNMQVVSYYVRLKEDLNQPGRLIGALVRQTPEGTEELIEGVDRFDLRYGVFGNDGMRYMNADALYDLNGGTLGCPPAPGNMPPGYDDISTGCLLRNTATVEVSLLVNTIDNLSVTESEVYRYSGAATLPTAVDAVDPSVTPPNILPPGSMLRREFRETIRLKNVHW